MYIYTHTHTTCTVDIYRTLDMFMLVSDSVFKQASLQ